MIRFPSAGMGAFALVLLLSGCGEPAPGRVTPAAESPAGDAGRGEAAAIEVAVPADTFTQANYTQIRVTHLELDLDVDFRRQQLYGTATLNFERLDPGATDLVLDTKGLDVTGVHLAGEGWDAAPTDYALEAGDPVLGAALRIDVQGSEGSDYGRPANQVKVFYSTSPDAEGLQWLSPAQTAGKRHPYLFSQAQALNARTMAPVQDTPAVRMTYSATLRVPDGLLPLMSAEQQGQDDDGAYRFNMPQPIPSYLLAIAVGDIKFKEINDHIGVYAEDYILDAAVDEFMETPFMEAANESLYGPYRWGRYDLIVLPPSFPFGGMENPRLSFMTPTLIAGDRSLTNVVAHELAHSWSGNLVTNSTWRDAWLNEGFTSYVENRVMERLYGRRRAVMEQALGLEDLKRDIANATRPELTQLKLPDDLVHPDEAFTQVAYVKGQFFLMFLEERFGRPDFDAFLKDYFDHFAFQSITTEDFLAYLETHLRRDNPNVVSDAELDAWINGTGLPETAADPQSDAFDLVADQSARWSAGTIALEQIDTAEWSTHEWLHFVNGLPDDLGAAQFAELDAAYGFTGTANAETAFAWYMQAIRGGYEPAFPALEGFLLSVGRGKFIYRLYGALEEVGRGEWAREVYQRARPGYHPIAQRRIDGILAAE